MRIVEAEGMFNFGTGWSATISFAALACVGSGLLVFLRGARVCDGIIRGLLHDVPGDAEQHSGSNQVASSSRREQRMAWFLGATVLGTLAVALHSSSLAQIALYLLLGCVGGELVHRGTRERRQRKIVRRLEFHLPTAMERVVMAVGAGLDIVPALSEAARKSADPVSDIFRSVVSLSAGGLRVEHAIQMTAERVPCSSIKHALVHLALAYKQGGEVVRPLKELSDATQTQYQESVEEEIAKLPVRAVAPLLLTFAGLIVCFLTVPVVQVGASLEKFAHATK
jgi:archaellum biogenesis protein FlaJ (TadC family)